MKLRLPRVLRRSQSVISHEQSLLRLKSLGFAPRSCYDIGAYRGEWTRTAKRVFPDAAYCLFEANRDNAAALAASGERYFMAALGSEDGVQREFYLPNPDTTATGASLYRETTIHYTDQHLRRQTVTLRRLDALIAEHALTPPDLIKLDVQGAELDVLAGAGAALESCSALLAELSLLNYNAGAPLLAEAIGGIDRLGFKCVDLCEAHHSREDLLLQIDLLFVNRTWFEKFHAGAELRP